MLANTLQNGIFPFTCLAHVQAWMNTFSYRNIYSELSLSTRNTESSHNTNVYKRPNGRQR